MSFTRPSWMRFRRDSVSARAWKTWFSAIWLSNEVSGPRPSNSSEWNRAQPIRASYPVLPSVLLSPRQSPRGVEGQLISRRPSDPVPRIHDDVPDVFFNATRFQRPRRKIQFTSATPRASAKSRQRLQLRPSILFHVQSIYTVSHSTKMVQCASFLVIRRILLDFLLSLNLRLKRSFLNFWF